MFVEAGKPLVDILEEHLEELAVLWQRLRAAQQSADYYLPDLTSPRDRFAAHVDGLVLGGDASRPVLLAGLSSDVAADVAAAAFVLLRLDGDGVALVCQAFEAAQGEVLQELIEVLAQNYSEEIETRLLNCAEQSPAAVAAAAGEVLARCGRRQPAEQRLAEFLAHDDPAVRRSAWRISALRES